MSSPRCLIARELRLPRAAGVGVQDEFFCTEWKNTGATDHEWVGKGVAGTPAWGMSLAYDLTVVQELGNAGPGRGLGKAFALLKDSNLLLGEKQV